MSTPNTNILPNMSSCNHRLVRTNYDKRMMSLYKFEETPKQNKVHMKNTPDNRSEFDMIMLKRFGY